MISSFFLVLRKALPKDVSQEGSNTNHKKQAEEHGDRAMSTVYSILNSKYIDEDSMIQTPKSNLL